MRQLLGVHHIPMHQSLEHRQFIEQLQPGIYKVVVVGEEVDTSWCPPGAILVVRQVLRAMAEAWGDRPIQMGLATL